MNFDTLCQVCQEKSAPYKCPKCQLKYCSLTCYRDRLHQKCAKQFDEQELIDSMNVDGEHDENQTTTNDFVRQRIEDIMKRKLDEKEFHNEEDDEQIEDLFEHLLPTGEPSESYREEAGEGDEDEEEAEERLASDDEEPIPPLPDDIDESDENVNQLWNYLTSDEKKEFKTMLHDGRISHLLNDYKPWKPWWIFKTSAPPLVTDLEEATTTTAATASSPPALPETVPTIVPDIVPLPSLTSILPHVHVRFDLFEVLFAYVLISVRYRGDFHSYVTEAGAEFIHIASRHLTHKPDIFDDQQESLSIIETRISLLRECLQEESISCRLSEDFFVHLFVDIISIVHGPFTRQASSNTYVLAALSDLKRFLVQIQEYKPPAESAEQVKPTANVINVFHANRPVQPKAVVNRPANSKLCLRSTPATSKSSVAKSKSKATKPTPFNRKLVQSLTRKIDYLLSWATTHTNRLVMLESELEQVECDLRHDLERYQRDKDRIEKNLKHIRLQQTANAPNRIQEL